MTQTPRNTSSETPTPKIVTDALGHLAFCGLIALHLARQDGNLNSPYAENLFLLRWLAQAQKQKRFPKIVAQDIVWLLERGRRRGSDANLRKHIEYLYRSCTSVIEEQTDLFRLTYAIETLKERGWQNQLLSAKEWRQPEKALLPGGFSVLYTEKNALQASFDNEGTLRQSLPLMASGNVEELLSVFEEYELSLNSLPSHTSLQCLMLEVKAS